MALACSSGSEYDDVAGGIASISFTALPYDANGGLEVEEAWVSIGWLELGPCSNDYGSIGEENWPANLLFDPPSRLDFGTGVLDYCAILLELRPSPSDSTPLEGLTAFVHGTRADGAPVVIETRSALDVNVAGPSFNVSNVALGFDLATWLADVDVDAAELDAEGVARIDEAHNRELQSAFEAGLVRAPSVYQDYDRDGRVDEDELTPVATPE